METNKHNNNNKSQQSQTDHKLNHERDSQNGKLQNHAMDVG